MSTRARAIVLIVTVLHATLLQAQLPAFGETVEVRVTNVEAVVTDRSGKPVHGLTKEDFEVYENGVKQEITNFAELGERSAPAKAAVVPAPAVPEAAPERDVRRRLISVFIDDATLEGGNRASVLPQLKKFLAENVRPGDGVAIYAWGRSLSVLLDPTSEPAAIAAAIDGLDRRTAYNAGAWKREYVREVEEVVSFGHARLEDLISIASGYAGRLSSETRQKVSAIKSVIASLRGVEGRKVLVLLTQSLSSNPGAWAFEYIPSVFPQAASYNPMSEARPYQIENVVTDIAKAANTAGVTLYPIQAEGKFTDNDFQDATSQPTDRTPVVFTDTSTTNLFAVADETGGKAMAGSSNWKLAFDTIANDLNVYYSIGYRTSGERQDRLKNVEVRLRKRGYNVRTRKAIIEQTAATEMNDVVAANLFQSSQENDLGITVATGAPTINGENRVYPLTITIPTSTLTLVPDGNDLAGRFSVFAAFLRGDGAVSSVGRQTQEFRFPAASLAKRKEVKVKLDVTADPTVGLISLGVMDEVSKATGYQLLKLDVAPQ